MGGPRNLVRVVTAAGLLTIGVSLSSLGAASASSVVDTVDNSNVSCDLTAGTATFKVPVGNVTPGGYQAPTKNRGNKVALVNGLASCTSPAVVQGSFTGTLKGKITLSNPTQTPAQFYSCSNGQIWSAPIPWPGGTLVGVVKIKWVPPLGVKFSQKTSTVRFSDTLDGFIGGHLVVVIPDLKPISVSGAFVGGDGGKTSSVFEPIGQLPTSLTAQCTKVGGVSSVPLSFPGAVPMSLR